MKKLFAMAILVMAGCSQPASSDGVPDIRPGTFTGVWKQGVISVACTTFVVEADTILKASVVNDSTKEVLTLNGQVPLRTIDYITRTEEFPNQPFNVSDSSNFYADTDTAPFDYTIINSWFTYNTDTFYYYTTRGSDNLSIICNRVQ